MTPYMPHPLAAQFAKEQVAQLRDLEWEQLPNEFRNVPRLPEPELRRAPITKAAPCPAMTPNDWAAWGVDWTK